MSSRFDVRQTPITGVRVIERKPVADHRGSLERMFCDDELQAVLGERKIRQINLTRTPRRGTTRGMHFQRAPFTEIKFVSCLRGMIYDVAVDLRRRSPTFLRWHGEFLGADTHTTLVIPEGVAHGFQAVADDCELLYLHTNAYSPAAEGGVHPGDPRLAIAWPEPITELSARDAGHPLLTPDFLGVAT